MIGGILFIVVILIVVVWLLIELKRMRHKFFAIFLIILILLAYISFAVVFKDKEIDFKTVSGVINAGKIYFGWLSSVFGNLKTITTYAIKMNWGNESSASK